MYIVYTSRGCGFIVSHHEQTKTRSPSPESLSPEISRTQLVHTFWLDQQLQGHFHRESVSKLWKWSSVTDFTLRGLVFASLAMLASQGNNCKQAQHVIPRTMKISLVSAATKHFILNSFCYLARHLWWRPKENSVCWFLSVGEKHYVYCIFTLYLFLLKHDFEVHLL